MAADTNSADIASDRFRARVRAAFDAAAETYERLGIRFFDLCGAWLVEAADLRRGERVLDIGSGRGAVTFPAAAAVGPTGRVVAIDLSPRMVTLLAHDACARGVRTVEVRVGDAQDPSGVEGPFDCIAGGFVLFFLSDARAALLTYGRLLRDGGRLALSTFGAPDERWSWVQELRDMVPAETEQPSRRSTNPPAAARSLEALLEEAGFEHPASIEREVVATFQDAGHWMRWSRSHGQRMMWDGIPAHRVAEAEALAARRVDELAAATGAIRQRLTVRLTTAQRAFHRDGFS